MIANSDQRTMYANRMGDNPINHADKCCVVVGTIFFVLLVVVVVFLERKYEDRCIRSENGECVLVKALAGNSCKIILRSFLELPQIFLRPEI